MAEDRKAGANGKSVAEKANSYRHGELPRVLMKLALEHIEQRGTEKLSLRALAREAGVSPTAPYCHFSSKQDLLATIATQGFQRLREKQHAVITGSAPPEERLVGVSLAYVEFALQNPTCYQLMFGSLLGDFSKFAMLKQAVTASYTEVDALLEEIITSRALHTDTEQLGGVIWSFLHGMSSLLINEVCVGEARSKPMQAIAALRRDHEAALRLMFTQLLGPGEAQSPRVSVVG